jgi:hypothetical protein
MSRSRQRAHPLRAVLLLVAMPLAAWSAVRLPQASASKESKESAVPVPAEPAPTTAAVAPRARHVTPPHPTPPKKRGPDLQTILRMHAIQQRVAVWDELAHCESGGDWNVVDRYGGGLGIYIGTWRMFHGDEFASNPGYATKSQQIIVAERIYARYGFDGWGCAHTLGWVN